MKIWCVRQEHIEKEGDELVAVVISPIQKKMCEKCWLRKITVLIRCMVRLIGWMVKLPPVSI